MIPYYAVSSYAFFFIRAGNKNVGGSVEGLIRKLCDVAVKIYMKWNVQAWRVWRSIMDYDEWIRRMCNK